MYSFIEGTLLISNVLLIFFSVIYGVLILKEKKKEESRIWVYFLIASAIYFISELFSVLNEILYINTGLLKAFLRIAFGIVVLFAFLSKYSSLHKRNH